MARQARQYNCEFPYHLTGRINNREKFAVPLEEAWNVTTDYLYLVQRMYNLRLHAFVLMPNHFHLLARAPHANFSVAMQYFMRETSREFGRQSGRINRVWGRPYHPSLIDSQLYYLHAYKYIYRNPVRARLCQSVVDWPYSSLAVLLGQRRSALPLEYDETLFSDLQTTLKWLDESYPAEDEDALRCALRHSRVEFRKDPSQKLPSPLTTWSSVPLTLRDPEKVGDT